MHLIECHCKIADFQVFVFEPNLEQLVLGYLLNVVGPLNLFNLLSVWRAQKSRLESGIIKKKSDDKGKVQESRITRIGLLILILRLLMTVSLVGIFMEKSLIIITIIQNMFCNNQIMTN